MPPYDVESFFKEASTLLKYQFEKMGARAQGRPLLQSGAEPDFATVEVMVWIHAAHLSGDLEEHMNYHATEEQ